MKFFKDVAYTGYTGIFGSKSRDGGTGLESFVAWAIRYKDKRNSMMDDLNGILNLNDGVCIYKTKEQAIRAFKQRIINNEVFEVAPIIIKLESK